MAIGSVLADVYLLGSDYMNNPIIYYFCIFKMLTNLQSAFLEILIIQQFSLFITCFQFALHILLSEKYDVWFYGNI